MAVHASKVGRSIVGRPDSTDESEVRRERLRANYCGMCSWKNQWSESANQLYQHATARSRDRHELRGAALSETGRVPTSHQRRTLPGVESAKNQGRCSFGRTARPLVFLFQLASTLT